MIKTPRKDDFICSRTVSRFAAIQALFQISYGACDSQDVVDEFLEEHFHEQKKYDLFADDEMLSVDKDFFVKLLQETLNHWVIIEELVQKYLPERWSLERLERTTKFILYVGTCELLFFPDVPTTVILNEYTTIGRSFLLERGYSFVNAILDLIAQKRSRYE